MIFYYFNLNIYKEHTMKYLKLLLSAITVQYGVTFFKEESILIKVICRLLFILSLIKEIESDYYLLGQVSILDFAGFSTFYLGSLVYGWILITKRNLLVKLVLQDAKLFNRIQYKKIILCIIFVLTITIIDLITRIVLLYDQLVDKTSKGHSIYDRRIFILTAELVLHPYYQWNSFSALFYGLIYFQMNLRNDLIIEKLLLTKYHSYPLIYDALTQFKINHENFDDLMSLLPAIWMAHIFLGVGAIIRMVVDFKYSIMSFSLLVKDFLCWTIVYFLIYKCHRNLNEKINKLKYTIAVKGPLDEPKGLTLQLLDQMSSIHVTAGHLVKLDTSLPLPFVGSICTYTFLFMDTFLKST